MLPFALLTAGATAALLVAERRDARAGVWLAKPLAAAGFVGVAVVGGALASPYGIWVVAALLLSWLGDVLLIPRGSGLAFRAGLAAFLLAHLAYVVAFAVRGLDLVTAAVAMAAVLVPSLLALRHLQPHLPAAMRAPVLAYLVVISVMVVCAAGTVGGAGDPRIFAGALAFYASDLAVARQRFVAPAFANKLWGLPLYFGGQLLLASSAAA